MSDGAISMEGQPTNHEPMDVEEGGAELPQQKARSEGG
jgi:hypothetical protein